MFIPVLLAMSFAWQAPRININSTNLDSANINSTPDTLELVELRYEEEARQQALEKAQQRQFESATEHRFEMKFNGVARALAEFGDAWNHSHKIDAGKAKKLRRAWLDLEKTEPWFDTRARDTRALDTPR